LLVTSIIMGYLKKCTYNSFWSERTNKRRINDKWTIKRVGLENEQTNERRNERTNDGTNERRNERTTERTNERTSGQKSEQTADRTNTDFMTNQRTLKLNNKPAHDKQTVWKNKLSLPILYDLFFLIKYCFRYCYNIMVLSINNIIIR
jgi:hypothetical protein